MQKPIISVIVAIYNAQKTLPRLIDSLKAQTMTGFEVLLIDDGSIDTSGSICDEVAKSNDRFKVFHKPNEGIGSTRQFGIDHALGEYTIHADADDWVEPDYLEILYKKASESGADMTICDYYEENGKHPVYCKQEISAFDKDGFLFDLFYNLQGGPCNKLLKRSVYQERGIRFKPGLNYGEDKLFNLELAMTGITVAYVPMALYHYDMVVNPSSAIHGYSIQNILAREEYVATLREFLPNSFQIGIDNRNLDVVYLAIKARVFDKTEFARRYSFLSRVKWREYQNMAFSIKVIIWTALHISYSIASFMSIVKKAKGQLKR